MSALRLHRRVRLTRHHWPLSVSLLLLALANYLANRLFPHADVLIGIAVTLTLLVVAHRAGMRPAHLGLSHWTYARGLRWGLGASTALALLYGVVLLVPAVRANADPVDQPWPAAAFTVLVVIPLATAIPEELAFRGVLLALLHRHTTSRRAVVISSLLFAVWHLLPALSGSAANLAADRAATDAGVGLAATALRVAGTLALTFAGGLVFCELRRRAHSLLAPVVAHWALNGLGVLFLMLA